MKIMKRDLFRHLEKDLDELIQKIKLFQINPDPILEREIRMLMIEMRGFSFSINGIVANEMNLLSNDIVQALQNREYHKLSLLYKDAADLKNNLRNL